jgi:hypothetical protein
MVDIGALQLRNENVRAVGNMSVNARGDLVDSMNRPIQRRTEQVAKQYNKQTRDTEAPSSGGQSTTPAAAPTAKKPKKTKEPVAAPAVEIPPTPEDFQDDFVKEPEASADEPSLPANLPPSGLAAAIARAREIKQEPLKTPRQSAQDAAGVRKI